MYYQNESDETLVMLTLANEQAAYEALVIRYQKAVTASAAAVTKNTFMAEDAAQDAFVTAWMKLNTLQDPKKYGSWVCRIAKNCALNMISRYRRFLPLDAVDNLNITGDGNENPAELYALSEGRSEVSKSVAMLPAKVRQIIEMHYFDGLSIAEIADRMRISEGTVKRQLHDGRKRIRKELCAMDEKYSDTLVQRVMKKVEELKLWQVKNEKSGFEKVYAQVLREVEELPECTEKQRALADVLMRGWWWLPGEKNDALFARIADAATEGKNEEVMTFIVTREDSRVYGNARIDFIRDKQIPRLEKAGFVKALGQEWFWLGYNLCRQGKAEEGNAAYGKAEEILSKDCAFRTLVPLARRMEEELTARYKETVPERYVIGGTAEEYRIIDGRVRFWAEEGFEEGLLGSIDRRSSRILRNASSCDGHFFADIALGGSYVGSDGTRLSYLSDNETVDTPAGSFDHCRLWEVRRFTDTHKIVCKTFYKDGIGIVRQDHISDGATDTHLLGEYKIKGGDGPLPLFPGNTWNYYTVHSPDAIRAELSITVSYADDGRILVSYWESTERIGYDPDSWLDTIQEVANEYVHSDKKDIEHICDVYPAIDRAERLAVTPTEKAHTRAAASVARRILATDPEFNPDHTATGHWNFFGREYIRKNADTLYLTDYNYRWSFEWKNTGDNGNAETPILFNDVLGILQDATNCIWSDEWYVGASPIIEYIKYDRTVKTQITCEDGGRITTKAGTFDNCLKLCLDIEGMGHGMSYRNGKKVYYFAEGIGIVRTENEYCGGAMTAVYELTSYEGTGEGFMPLADGLLRRYDALDLTDGFVGAAEYTYVADEDGDIVVFSDRTGIRELTAPITLYSSVQREKTASDLWAAGKRQETQMKTDANSFHLILHLIARPTYNRKNAKRSIAINSFNLKLLESLSVNGEVMPAWYGLYSWKAAILAAALFADGQKDAGYQALDKAVGYCEKSAELKDGDLLEIGDPHLFGGAKLIRGKGVIQCADGSLEPVDYAWQLEYDGQDLFYSLTASHGWEWFNSVRNEDRFKAYVERTKNIAGMGV